MLADLELEVARAEIEARLTDINYLQRLEIEGLDPTIRPSLRQRLAAFLTRIWLGPRDLSSIANGRQPVESSEARLAEAIAKARML